ncbi:MAG: aminomethyl-transferring glycine dehydrogenase subunit GcvPB, partial [Methanomassiliicoccales archaeon]
EKMTKMLVPDSAHGTNPASAAMAGFDVIEVESENGLVSPSRIKKELGEDVAGLMLTNPNTLGLFETEVRTVTDLLHSNGSLLYYDGANMNAIIGITNPGLMGFDIVHFNLHKTFATPHGGGGPGAGPVGVKNLLKPFLPTPIVVEEKGSYRLDYGDGRSIGKLHSFFGNFAILVRAYIYIMMNGASGLRQNSEMAVLNSNYLMSKISGAYEIPFRRLKKHEFVMSARKLKKEKGITASDVAKYLIDCGIHPPTIYFPLVVEEALMVEPTENLTKTELDRIAEYFNAAAEMDSHETGRHPSSTPVSRIDEVKAAKDMVFRWQDIKRDV